MNTCMRIFYTKNHNKLAWISNWKSQAYFEFFLKLKCTHVSLVFERVPTPGSQTVKVGGAVEGRLEGAVGRVAVLVGFVAPEAFARNAVRLAVRICVHLNVRRAHVHLATTGL